jgi:hypothetical protein
MQPAASRGGDLPVLKLVPGRDVGVAGQRAVRTAGSAASRPPVAGRVAGRGAVPASAAWSCRTLRPGNTFPGWLSRQVRYWQARVLLCGGSTAWIPFPSSTRTGTPRRHEPIDETTAIPAILSAVKGAFAQAAGG